MKVSTVYLHLYTDGNNHCRIVDEWTLEKVSTPYPLRIKSRVAIVEWSECRRLETSG